MVKGVAKAWESGNEGGRAQEAAMKVVKCRKAVMRVQESAEPQISVDQ